MVSFTFVHITHCLAMLTSGMVPALYADEEKESVLSGIRDEAEKLGIGSTKEALWQYFVAKCCM